MIPEEDRGPAWLRNWEYIEADIQAMDDFAKKLRADVEKNYASHLTPIYDDMATALPAVSEGFPELAGLLRTHQQATETTTSQVHDYANRSAAMAFAASEISSNYRQSDAFAQASLSDVHNALGAAGAAGQSGGTPTVPLSGSNTASDGARIPTTEGY